MTSDWIILRILIISFLGKSLNLLMGKTDLPNPLSGIMVYLAHLDRDLASSIFTESASPES